MIISSQCHAVFLGLVRQHAPHPAPASICGACTARPSTWVCLHNPHEPQAVRAACGEAGHTPAMSSAEVRVCGTGSAIISFNQPCPPLRQYAPEPMLGISPLGRERDVVPCRPTCAHQCSLTRTHAHAHAPHQTGRFIGCRTSKLLTPIS